MASQFAAHIHSARHQLVSDLVVKLVDVQVSSQHDSLAPRLQSVILNIP